MVEELNMGEEYYINLERSFITMEEPASGTEERDEQLSLQSNKQNDKVTVQSALRQYLKKRKKAGKKSTILVFHYRKHKKPNENLMKHKQEPPKSSDDESDAL